MIAVANRQRRVRVTAAEVRTAVRATFAAESAGDPSLSVAIVDDATIREVNRRWLDHDWATDAIAFSYEDDPSPEGERGEVIVSAETARREADARGQCARHELLLYVVHGTLHLLGWDDDTPRRRTAMNRRAAQILAAAGFAPQDAPTHASARKSTSDASARDRARKSTDASARKSARAPRTPGTRPR